MANGEADRHEGPAERGGAEVTRYKLRVAEGNRRPGALEIGSSRPHPSAFSVLMAEGQRSPVFVLQTEA